MVASSCNLKAFLVVCLTPWVPLILATSPHGPFHEWIVSRVSMSVDTYYHAAAYDANSGQYSECIFLLGGVTCDTCLDCYNITSETRYTFDTLSNSAWNIATPWAVMVPEGRFRTTWSIYYHTSTGYFRRFNLDTRIETEVVSRNVRRISPCLTISQDYSEIYIVVGSTWKDFYIYDVPNANLIQGPSLPFDPSIAACTINSWRQDPYQQEEPFLYVFGANRVERIPTRGLVQDIQSETNTYRWRTKMLVTGKSSYGIASYANYIYLIAGFVDSALTSAVSVLDLETWQLSNVGEFLESERYVETIVALDRIYAFGGSSSRLISFTNIADASDDCDDCDSSPGDDADACEGDETLQLDVETALFYCEDPDPPTPEPTRGPSAQPTLVPTEPCPKLHNQLTIEPCDLDNFCDDCRPWGCKTCLPGYFRYGGPFRACLHCTTTIPNCLTCTNWAGCTQCAAGYNLETTDECGAFCI